MLMMMVQRCYSVINQRERIYALEPELEMKVVRSLSAGVEKSSETEAKGSLEGTPEEL